MNKTMGKRTSDLSANETIYEAIKQIAWHKLVNPRTQAVKHTSRVTGYVVKVHTDASDELCGTVDVQEYLSNLEDLQAKEKGLNVGLHEGVYLSAIQNNENGIVTIPFLYSDVVIGTDPDTLKEYVIQYSHADTVQIDAHGKIVIGVTETEDYEESEDTPDYNELKKTGVHAHTTYTPRSALTEVAASNKKEEQSKLELTPEKVEVAHDKAATVLDNEKAAVLYDKSQLIADAQQLLAKYNAKEIIIKEDGVYVGSGSANEPAVLGNQLATLLIDWLGALSQMMTPTMMGPQPPTVLAKFVSLQAKVNSYKAATSGILSKTVKIAQ